MCNGMYRLQNMKLSLIVSSGRSHAQLSNTHHTMTIVLVFVSANHPYLQPEG